MFRKALVTLFATALLAAPLVANSAAPPPPSKDPKAARPGVYNLDTRHSGVIARVPHAGGFSYSVFRLSKTTGTLNWDSAAPANSS